MKYLPVLALLCVFSAGCGSSEPATRNDAPADPRAAERAELRSRVAAKQQEMAQTDGDLAKIATERESLSKEEASQKKTDRLVELARLESDLKLRKAAQEEEIANLQQQLGGPAPTAKKPEKAGDALDDILASGDKDKEDAERRKKKAEEDSAADKSRIAQAEMARKAELDERAKQKVEGGRAAAGGEDGPAFEERWADVIQKVREEVQKYKKF